MDPTHSYFSQESHCQKGIGVPQYRSREMAQSCTFRSHSPNRPHLMWPGYQFTLSLLSSRVSLIAVVLMYQELLA